MKTLDLLALRDMPAEALVNAFENQTTELFDTARRLETPDIVVIPACNEQEDIPANLLSLSRSKRPVVPIVVENGSDAADKTREYAGRMGALVLHCEPAKMRATQVGLALSRERFPSQPVVQFGDADNLYLQNTISTVSDAVHMANARNEGNGALVFGMSAFDHGASLAVDAMRTGRLIRKAVQRKLKGQVPMPNGNNYALHVGKNEQVIEAIDALDPLLFVREESEICRVALAAGLIIDQVVRPTAFVLTRSDLIRSRAEWREFKGASMGVKAKYYKRNYPGISFLPNSNGR